MNVFEKILKSMIPWDDVVKVASKLYKGKPCNRPTLSPGFIPFRFKNHFKEGGLQSLFIVLLNVSTRVLNDISVNPESYYTKSIVFRPVSYTLKNK